MMKILKFLGILIIANIKKILIIGVILMISSFSYYGAVDEKGEKVISFEQNSAENALNNEVIEEQQEVEQEEKTGKTEEIEPIQTELQDVKNDNIGVQSVSKSTQVEEKNKTKEVVKETKKQEEIKETQQEKKQDETKTEQEKEQEEINYTEVEVKIAEVEKCSDTRHGIEVGNSNKWFDSKQDAIKYYEDIIKTWGEKWTNYEIDSETYYKNCPSGYEIFSCPYCEKWTINLFY